MGTKTGNNGFDINGQTYEFDPGDLSSPGISPVPSDKGDLTVDHSTKDLSKPTKTTLAQYLSDLTTGKQGSAKGTSNQYPVDPPANPVSEFGLSDDKGNPPPLSADAVNAARFSTSDAAAGTEVFSPDLQARNFAPNAYPVVPDVRTDPKLTLGGFVKGKSTVPGVNGNGLLPSVGKNNLPPPLKGFTSAVMTANRFTDASVAIAEVQGSGNDTVPDDYDPKLYHPRYGEVNMGRLAQVGTALSLRAAQALNADSPGNNPTGDMQELKTLIPSPAQLGVVQINSLVTEAVDVLKTLTQESIPDVDYSDISSTSWGTLNSVDEPFWGTNSIGMNALAAALSSAIVILFEGLGFIIDKAQNRAPTAQRNGVGSYVLGGWADDPPAAIQDINGSTAFSSAAVIDVLDIAGTLNIRSTVFPFGLAVRKGVALFFGIDDSTIGSALASAITSGSDSVGFKIGVARTIIRSSIFIEQAFSAAFTSPDGGAALDNATDIIWELSRSRIIKAMNIFAMLGDVALSDPNTANVSPDQDPGQMVKKSTMDSYPNDGPAASVQKNRLQGSLKLAWSSNRAPALYLVPDAVASMQVVGGALGGFNGSLSTNSSLSNVDNYIQTAANQDKNGSRIPADKVQDLEDSLDAEYVPFYFHDLRTNEIIAFHAFLESLSENYAPSWESVEGFGRVDPIKIYKNTARKFNLSFIIAATSEEDFNDMWVKINKLVTLVYPQYTQGRLLTNGTDTTFVQPFSQMMSASPLIRMRLGDLVRSNYSRFALARLFGAADGVMQLPDENGNATTMIFEGVASNLDAFNTAKDKLTSKPDPTNRFTIDTAGWKLQPSLLGGIGAAVQNASGVGPVPSQAPELAIRGSDLQYFELEITAADPSKGTTVCNVHLLDPPAIVEKFGMNTEIATGIWNALWQRYVITDDTRSRVIGPSGYAIPAPMLTPTRKTLENLMRTTLDLGGINASYIDNLNNFLNPDKNALVKSFESTKGKGLAGVIESLDFEWLDRTPWEDKIGSKAPKMCKVTLSFSVIHDISPGIDWLGYNRSPIYPVGLGMKPGKDVK